MKTIVRKNKMILTKNQSEISYDIIIPVLSTTFIALIGYIMQLVTLWHTRKKENESKKIEAYADFYIELIFELNNIILIYQDYCARNGEITWKEFGKSIFCLLAENNAQGDDRNLISKFNSAIITIYKLFEEKKYYPISKKAHKNCMKLCLFADCIYKINQSNFLKSNIQKCSESILLPDLEKMLKQLTI